MNWEEMMTKEQVLEWLLVFGRDWVKWYQVNKHFTVGQKIRWAYDEHYIEHTKDDEHAGNHKYRLAPKALDLLND